MSASSSSPLSSLAAPPSSSSTSTPFNPSSNQNTTKRTWSNWAQTQSCQPAYFHTPHTVEDIRAVLDYAMSRNENVRVVGYGHSPGSITLTNHHMLALGPHFSRVLSMDTARMQVKVEAGISQSALNDYLLKHNMSVSTLGSISDQTLGGSLACGTHGSSARHASIIAAYVVELDIMDAEGVIHTCSAAQNPDLFNAARISLGCLGVILHITIQCEPSYHLLEVTSTISFDTLTNQQFMNDLLADANVDFLRMHWIPHTDTVILTRMKKVSSTTETATERRAKECSTLTGRVRQHLTDTKDRLIGYHLLESLYYVSSKVPTQWNAWMIVQIAKLYSFVLAPQMKKEEEIRMVESMQNAGVTAVTSSSSAKVSPASSSSSSTPSYYSPFPSSSSSSTWLRLDTPAKILNFDCLFKQYVTEWAIDQRYTVRALREIREYIRRKRLHVHFPIEIRFGGGMGLPGTSSAAAATSASTTTTASPSSSTSPGDSIWLSPCYSRPQTWIGIIMYRPYSHNTAYEEYFLGFERLMNGFGKMTNEWEDNGQPEDMIPPFDGKPHWAKNISMSMNEIPFEMRFARWKEFKKMREKMDPKGMFVNEYVKNLFELEEKDGKKKENDGGHGESIKKKPASQIQSNL